ncbi:MAG: hypothetical protein M0D55_09180 [Elusimicrobiota bacterium]|nr:MAG: hypothetical protein M0D55_09180 [Elusimicrobiota bacterium]
MSLENRLRSLDRRIGPAGLLLTGAAVLGAAFLLGRWAAESAAAAADERAALSVAREDLDLDIAERQALSELASRDLKRAKESATSLSRSRKALFEGGLAISEEKRLLEKQLEIMSLWIRVDEEAGKVHLVRGDQIAESLALAGARARAVGGETRAPPRAASVVTKERFASPERPKSDQVGGQLQWEPPQVGTSVRASALGEHVLFTKEGLVVHGPPLKEAEHEAYPHLCLSLPGPVARRLYTQSYVGTKLLFAAEGAP